MSLFSRLDRVRNNGRDAKDRDEGGMFGVPDLGAATPPADQGAAPSAPQPPVSAPASIPEPAPAPQAATPVVPPVQPETAPTASQETASPFAVSPFSVSSLPPQNTVEDEPVSPDSTGDAAQDLANLAIGDSEPVKESPFMSAIAPSATSAKDRLPTVQGPFKRPALFDKDKQAEPLAEASPVAAPKQEPFVSDDTSLPSAVADVALPSVADAGLPSIPEAALPSVAAPAPAPAAPVEPPPVKSPFDRLMAERVPVANPNPTVPPVVPPSDPPRASVTPINLAPSTPPQPSGRSSLLDRLNARAAATAATEQSDAAASGIPAAPAPVPAPPVIAAAPPPPVASPAVAEAPLDRDAEIPDEYIPDPVPAIPAAPVIEAAPTIPSASIPAAPPIPEPTPATPVAASIPELSIPAAPSIPAASIPEAPAIPVAPPAPVTPPTTEVVPPKPQPAPLVEESLPSVPEVSATNTTAPSKPMAEQEPNEGSGAFSPQRPNPDTPLENYPLERMNTADAGANRNLASRATGLRGFADRLAARETLDRDLQVPANEPASRPSGAELVRIDEEANLSEKEMKVRILYRQKHLVFDSVLGSIDPRLMQNPTRETMRPAVEKAVDGALREFNLLLDAGERSWMIDEFVRETTDVGPLVPLLDDPGISKIIITGANDVSVEKLGRIERVGISFRDDDHLLGLVRRIAEMTGGRIDAKVPLLDRPLPDGSRIRAKVPPIAPQPSLTIEKSTGNPFIALKRMQSERSRGEALPYNQLRERIQVRLLREFEGNTAATANQEKLRSQVEEMIGQVILEERVAVTRAEKAALVMDLLNEIVGLGPLEPLLNDPDVDEVMVNGPYQIYVERKGKLEISNQRFRDNAHAMQVVERILAPLGRRIDEKSPMVDGRLRDGSRFNAIIPPLALGGPTMTIRKFARDPFTMTDLINFGSLTREAAQFLHAAVEGRLNIIVSGGTGSGKTTTLNVISSFIPASDRIITIEDAAELQLRQEHTIRLETRPANIEGVGEIAIRDLVRNALRMRPDRIVVGECRGGEALDMLQAMNTGHDGSLTTAHSNGPRDTLKRLETMVMMAGFDLPVKAIREQIAMAVQVIVHQERMRDGKRRITAITEIVGMEGDVITMQDLFRFEQERIDEEGRIHGTLAPTGLRPKNWDTMVDHGVELSMEMFQRQPVDGGVRSRLSGAR